MFGSTALPASALSPIHVPLTLGQKVRLLVGCLPLVAFAALLAGYLVLVQDAIVPPPRLLFYLFSGGVIVIIGYQAVQHLRDLVSGVALAQEDLLKRSSRAPGGYAWSNSYGRFERLGTLRMGSKLYVQHGPGQRYRVVYSPASKIV